MSVVSPLRITRFAQLPRHTAEIWQGSLVCLPARVEHGPDGRPYRPSPLPASYAFGSEEEAVLCADELGDAWRATPGTEAWLTASTPKAKSRTRRPRRER